MSPAVRKRNDTDGDGVSDLDDACDDTPFGFPVLADGCTDESALDTDLDGDGYSGVYAYDIDPVSGEIITSIKGRGQPSPATPPNGSTRTGTASATTPHPPTTPTTVQPNLARRTLISSAVMTMVMVIETRMSLNQQPNRPSGGIPTSMDTAIIGATLHGTPLETTTGPVGFVEGATNADYCPLTTLGLPVDEEGCHVS